MCLCIYGNWSHQMPIILIKWNSTDISTHNRFIKHIYPTNVFFWWMQITLTWLLERLCTCTWHTHANMHKWLCKCWGIHKNEVWFLIISFEPQMQSPLHGDGVVTCNLEAHCLSASEQCWAASAVEHCVFNVSS